jgi:hypothetical protein
MQWLQQAGDEPAEAGRSLAGHQADAVGSGIGDGGVLDRFVQVGDVACAVGARDVVEGSAQDERELGAAMAVRGYDAAGGDLQQAELAPASERQTAMPYAYSQPPPADAVEFAVDEARERLRYGPAQSTGDRGGNGVRPLACALAIFVSVRARGLTLYLRRQRLRSVQRRRRQLGQQGAADALQARDLVAAAPAHGDMGRRHGGQRVGQSPGGEAHQRCVVEVMRDGHRRSSSPARIF